MMDAVLYIHGKGGNAEEAEHYRPLFPDSAVLGLDYKGTKPWDVGKEIHKAIAALKAKHDRILIVANSIGAFFSMNADIGTDVDHAFFISPIVDMEKLISDMLGWAGVSETQLREKGTIQTEFGEELSWEYLCFVRNHPVSWEVPTDILYGSGDHLTSIETIKKFTSTHHASLTIMDNGEHWFHTPEQMQFLDNWIKTRSELSI